MILEVALLHVIKTKTEEFLSAFEKAQKIISKQKGYLQHQLQRCLEHPDKFILLVNWNSLEDHITGFRQSEDYLEWKKLLHHFYDPFPTVEHYEKIF